MLKRYQYWGKGAKIVWSKWFETNYKAPKPAFKNLKEEYKDD